MAAHRPDPVPAAREPVSAGREPVSVLLAEHEPEVAEMSARYLRQDGLRVRLVTSPEPTLAELAGGPDAAAVVDLTMPGLDPRRIRRALRTPVIFLVADAKAPRPRGLAVRGDAANLDDLDRLFDTVKREKGKIDVLYASAGTWDIALHVDIG